MHNEIPLFSEAELGQAVKSLQSKKHPKPDEIPTEVLQEIKRINPTVVLNMGHYFSSVITQKIKVVRPESNLGKALFYWIQWRI